MEEGERMDADDGPARRPFLNERGRRAAVELMGPGGDDRMEEARARLATETDADWARIASDFIFNGMYSRGVLPSNVRELCAVAALTVLGRREPLSEHIKIAIRLNPPEHVREVILQMAVYGGVPVTLETLRLFDAAVSETVVSETVVSGTTGSEHPDGS
jgi:4-carboxymuconolactone decarboxylase